MQGAPAETPASARSAVLIAGAVGVLLTAVAVLAGGSGLSFRSPEGRIAIETAATVIPAVAAYLFYGRALRTGTLTDVVAAVALATLAVANFGFGVLPHVLGEPSETFAAWGAYAGRLAAGIGFVAAAFAPGRRAAEPRRALVRLSALATLVLVAVAGGVALIEDALPRVVGEGSAGGGADAGVVALELAAAAVFAVAAAGFVRRADRTGEQLLVWLAVSMALAAIGRLDVALDPVLVAGHVHAGDLARLAAHLALLVGAFREIGSYQHRVAESAVFQERRRLARELHDGLAQELSYISAQSRRLQSDSDEGRSAGDALTAAAERALEESRLAIAALTRPVDEPLSRSLGDAAISAGERAEVTVQTDLDPSVEVLPHVRDAMLRIVSEAIRNAARHGRAKTVWLSLRRGDSLVLTIRDDGCGFDPAAPRRPDSMGLRGMTERAEALGGRLSVVSALGSGTTVELWLP